MRPVKKIIGHSRCEQELFEVNGDDGYVSEERMVSETLSDCKKLITKEIEDKSEINLRCKQKREITTSQEGSNEDECESKKVKAKERFDIKIHPHIKDQEK